MAQKQCSNGRCAGRMGRRHDGLQSTSLFAHHYQTLGEALSQNFYFHIENVHCSCISLIYLLLLKLAFPSEPHKANQYRVYFDKENLFVTICCVSFDNFVNSVKLFIPKTKSSDVRFIFGKIKACRLKNHLNALNCNTISQ